MQEAHFLWLSQCKTGEQWPASLIVKLWEVAWDLWDHCNQVKKRVETAQDIARRSAIALAPWSPTAGLSPLQTPSSLHPLELPALHGRLAAPGPNWMLRESQMRRRSSQHCRQHRQRHLAKHEWPLPCPPAIPEPCRPTLVSLASSLAPSCYHLGVSPQGTFSRPASFGIDRLRSKQRRFKSLRGTQCDCVIVVSN